jgi:hypothetical protein
MARAYVRLLGPCFKTGQVDNSWSNAANAVFAPSLNQPLPPWYQQSNLFKISLPIQDEQRPDGTLKLLSITTVPCTRDAYPCADVEKSIRIYIDQRNRRQPVSHCRRGDPKSTNTTVVSHTSRLAAFNVLPAQLRLNQRSDCQLSIRLSTRLPLNGFTYFELSLQSSFQLSLTVLVRYRTRDRI